MPEDYRGRIECDNCGEIHSHWVDCSQDDDPEEDEES